MNSDRVRAFPGAWQGLRLVVEDPGAVTRVALDAIEVLGAAWEPLSAEAILFAVDGDDPDMATVVEVARPHRLLVSGAAGEGVRIVAAMRDPVTTTVPVLSRAAIESWLEDGLRDAAGERYHAEWNELAFRAGRAWAGPPDWRAGETELRLRSEAGTVVVPIERGPSGVWLSGPREPAFDQPPLDVRISHEMGLLRLNLTRSWGHWLDANEPAEQRYDELVGKLRAVGWES